MKIAALVVLTQVTAAAMPFPKSFAPDTSSPPSHAALRLTVHDYGLCFGNSQRTHGVRVNLSDRGLERVDGLNLTFWKPRDNPNAVINGIAVGLLAPAAKRVNGIALGGLAVVGESSLRGINIGGLAVVSEGEITGLNIASVAIVGEQRVAGVSVAGVAVVSEKQMVGAHLAGLAIVSRQRMIGINVSGLATVCEGMNRGLAVGGLATVSEHGATGIDLGGLAVVSEGSARGLTVSGLATVCGESSWGIAASGVAVACDGDFTGLCFGALAYPGRTGDSTKHWSFDGIRAERLTGLAVHGMSIKARTLISGVAISGLYLGSEQIRGFGLAPLVQVGEMKGIVAGAVNSISRRQTGLAIGLMNLASTLKGIQFGLLNYAGNNPRGLRLLPLVNLHLR